MKDLILVFSKAYLFKGKSLLKLSHEWQVLNFINPSSLPTEQKVIPTKYFQASSSENIKIALQGNSQFIIYCTSKNTLFLYHEILPYLLIRNNLKIVNQVDFLERKNFTHFVYCFSS